MTNADALFTIGSKGELIKQPTQVVGIGGAEGHEAKVNAKGELLVSTTLIAGEITIGNVKIEGAGGHVAAVNAEGKLQVNTENVVVAHTFAAVENVELEAPNGYEQITIWVKSLPAHTGLTLKSMAHRAGINTPLPLVSNNSTGTGPPTSTLLSNSAAGGGFSGPLPSGTEKILLECTALSTGEATVECVFGNEPWLPPSLLNVQGPVAVGSEPSGIAPMLIGGIDGETKMRRFITDGEGVQAVYPFETSHPWSSAGTGLSVGKEVESKEETIAGVAGFRFVITSVSVDADNTETLTEFGNVLVKITEETSARMLWRGNLKGQTLTKGSSQSINVAANPIAITTTTGKGIIIKIEKAVKGAEGTVTASGYMIKA